MKNIYISVKTNGTLRKIITKAFNMNLNRATLCGNRVSYSIHNNEEVYGVIKNFISVGEDAEVWLERCLLKGVEELKEVRTHGTVVMQLHDTTTDKYITYTFSHSIQGSYSIQHSDTGDIYHWVNTLRVTADDPASIEKYMAGIVNQDDELCLEKLTLSVGALTRGHLKRYNACKSPLTVKYYRHDTLNYIQFETNTYSQQLIDDLRRWGQLVQEESSPSLEVSWVGWDKVDNRSPRKGSALLTNLVTAKQNTTEQRWLLSRIVFSLPLKQDATSTLLSLVNTIKDKVSALAEQDSVYNVECESGGLAKYDMLVTYRVEGSEDIESEQRSLIRDAILEYLEATGDSLLANSYSKPINVFRNSFGLAVVSDKSESEYRQQGIIDGGVTGCIPHTRRDRYHPMSHHYHRCVAVPNNIPTPSEHREYIERMGATHYFITLRGVKWQRMGIESLFIDEDKDTVDFGIILPMPNGMTASEQITWMEKYWGTSSVKYVGRQPRGDDGVIHHIIVRGNSAALWRNALLKAIVKMGLNKVNISIDMEVRDSADSGYGEDRTYVINEKQELKIVQHVDTKKWVIGEDNRPTSCGRRLL